MAIAAEIEQISTSEALTNGVQQPEKRKPGRPRKVAAPDAEESPRKIPREDFWIDLANLSADDWSRTICYLFRLSPTIDRRSGGRPTNLKKYAAPFDRDDIMREHGSGAYRIDRLQLDEQTGHYTRVAQERFDILNLDFPPRVPPGDWKDEPENAVWKWAVPAIEAAAQGTAGYPPGFNVSDIMDKADQRALRMVEIMTPKENEIGRAHV